MSISEQEFDAHSEALHAPSTVVHELSGVPRENWHQGVGRRVSWLAATTVVAALLAISATVIADTHRSVVNSARLTIPAASGHRAQQDSRLPVLPPPTGAPKRRQGFDI